MVPLVNPPLRIMRGRRHDPHLMASQGQPFGHLSRVLADAGHLRREVNGMNQDSHADCLSSPMRLQNTRPKTLDYFSSLGSKFACLEFVSGSLDTLKKTQ